MNGPGEHLLDAEAGDIIGRSSASYEPRVTGFTPIEGALTVNGQIGCADIHEDRFPMLEPHPVKLGNYPDERRMRKRLHNQRKELRRLNRSLQMWRARALLKSATQYIVREGDTYTLAPTALGYVVVAVLAFVAGALLF